MKLSYVIKFVADMNRAVKFYRDVLGLDLKFASPGWSEFATGETTLALHAASEKNPAGSVELGYAVDDLQAFYTARETSGVRFTEAPRPLHGSTLATFLDCEDAECSISG